MVGSAQDWHQVSYHCHYKTTSIATSREGLLNIMHSPGLFDIFNKMQSLQIQEIKRNRLTIECNNNSDDHLRDL